MHCNVDFNEPLNSIVTKFLKFFLLVNPITFLKFFLLVYSTKHFNNNFLCKNEKKKNRKSLKSIQII